MGSGRADHEHKLVELSGFLNLLWVPQCSHHVTAGTTVLIIFFLLHQMCKVLLGACFPTSEQLIVPCNCGSSPPLPSSCRECGETVRALPALLQRGAECVGC